MNPFWCMVAFWIDGIGAGQAPGFLFGKSHLEKVNRHLHGSVLDFTNNHGHDRRLWSNALCQKRSLYVYLPPCYDPVKKKYPLAIFLHGAGQDEKFFTQAQVQEFDNAIASGQLPPVVIAAPDGTAKGRPSMTELATFFANSRAGRFEDYLIEDVYDFMMANFSIRPERDYHALVGASMGGCAAFAQAIKHKDKFKVAIGFMPPLNLRYVDCHGKYRTKFDPDCWGMRAKMRGLEALGRRKLVILRFDDLFQPMFGRGQQALEQIACINPLELMVTHDLKDGDLDLFVAYGSKDEFNIAAQVESFLYVAHQRGVTVTAYCDPNGRHDLASGKKMMPLAFAWAAQRVEVLEARERGGAQGTLVNRPGKNEQK